MEFVPEEKIEKIREFILQELPVINFTLILTPPSGNGEVVTNIHKELMLRTLEDTFNQLKDH